MEKLDSKIVLDAETIAAANLCDRFTEGELVTIGNWVWDGYSQDKRSRFKWERRTQAAMDLAMQLQKEKSFPWPGCANVAFPLITIAALNFHSRAYPAIISGTDVVKCRVIGQDDTGAKTERAKRISTHMSWQVLEEQQEWEEQQDRLLINLPIVGTAFKKSYWNSDKAHKTDELVLAQDLVLDYWSKSVECCPRKTHIIPFFRNQIHSNIAREAFRDVSNESWYQTVASPRQYEAEQARTDNRKGVTPPSSSDETTPFIILEQHVDLDLDQDGYAEPYIITIEEASKCVLRIVAGFEREVDITRAKSGKIVTIRRTEYFTKYEFIPSPDGGVYGVGFGVLLGPLNESTSTIINQLLDAGTMLTTRGGFLGRGAKMRGGAYTFAPFQWQRVDSTGDDLRKNVVPLEVGEPSQVLFQLLGLLINYVERISGTTDPMMGENPGQNTPASTMQTMVQEGQRVYSAVFKRIWRSMKEEFKKGYVLNGLYMPAKKSFGQGQFALREDYLGNPDEVCPAADPNVTSDSMAMSQAMALRELSTSAPGYNRDEVERRVLKTLKIDNIEQVYPGVEKMGAPEDVKVQIAKMKVQVDMAWLQHEEQKFAIQMQEQMRLDEAEIAKIVSEIETMQQDQQGDEADRMIALLNAQLGMLKSRNDAAGKTLDLVMKRMDVRMKEMELMNAKNENGAGAVKGNVRRLEGPRGNKAGGGGAGAQAA